MYVAATRRGAMHAYRYTHWWASRYHHPSLKRNLPDFEVKDESVERLLCKRFLPFAPQIYQIILKLTSKDCKKCKYFLKFAALTSQ